MSKVEYGEKLHSTALHALVEELAIKGEKKNCQKSFSFSSLQQINKSIYIYIYSIANLLQ
jgi:hypothetical protein